MMKQSLLIMHLRITKSYSRAVDGGNNTSVHFKTVIENTNFYKTTVRGCQVTSVPVQ